MEKVKRTAPDTLSLEQRADAALSALINAADEDYGYIPFFCGDFKSKPAKMLHGNWDYGSSHGRIVDSLVLAREMTGSNYGKDIEEHYRKNLLSFFHDDGLNYRRNSFDEATVTEHISRFEDSASMIDQRAVLLGLTSWYLETKDEKVKGYADRLVAALKRIARKERDSWYYPASEFTKHGWPSFDAVHTRLAVDPCAMWGRQIMPLVRYYKATGNRDAYELAENFAYNIINRSGAFLPDGSFNGALEYRNGHFHTRMGTLAAVAHFGELTQNSYYINKVKQSFDWARKNWCTSYGWTPGDMHDQAYEHETCSLVDMIDIAITLANNGFSEYYSVAEKFIRNHLTEAQLMDVSWIEEYDKKDKDALGFTSYYKTASRLRGAFAGYASPNDFVYDGLKGRGHIMDVQLCCIAAGIRALHQTWKNIVTKHNGRVWVNLLFNHSSDVLNLDSYLPHNGRLTIHSKETMPELLVRIPEWVPYGSVVVKSDKRDITGRELPWVNKCFINIQEVEANEIIEITFPMITRTTEEYAVDDKYITSWVGDDVVDISPKGTYYPLYSKRKIVKQPASTEVEHIIANSVL